MATSQAGRFQHQGQRIRPQPFVGRTLAESVSGFIQEVVPQSSVGGGPVEDKERVMWLKFEHCDLTDSKLCRKLNVGTNPPLLLIIGYLKGVQVWLIPEGGTAVELLSYRQATVKCFKILNSPELSVSSSPNRLVDEFSLKRPLAALCDSSSSYQTVSFQSLKTGEQVKAIKFTAPVQELYCNKRIFVVAFPTDLAVFNAADLEEMFRVTCCYPRRGDSLNPVALGSVWMAFADSKLYPPHRSKGGACYDSGSTYKSTVLHAAKSLAEGLLGFGETVASNIMGQSGSPPSAVVLPRAVPGIVTVLDTSKVRSPEVTLQTGHCLGIICHFEAHQGSPVACLEFDDSGLLLATADQNGHIFNVFKIHPNRKGLNVVQHLYTLKRGDTTAKVLSMSFSVDSRWICVSTHRGTAHVFPITPYGGPIEVRTHMSPCVVNRLSTYQISVGMQESEAGHAVPSRTTSPTARGTGEAGAMGSPQYAASGPIVVEPMVQIKQAMLQNLLDTFAKHSPTNSPPANSRSPGPSADDVKTACCFGVRRARLDGAANTVSALKQAPPFADALIVADHEGVVVEYDLKPKVSAGISGERQSETNPIELDAEPIAQWTLLREHCHREIRPPFHPISPLLASLQEPKVQAEPPVTKVVAEQWESQVELQSYVGPSRSLWMGPQFNFIPAEKMDDDARKQFLPDDGSAPTFVDISSLSHASDQSHRFGSSFGGESEEYMNKVKSDLADAMMDEGSNSPPVPPTDDLL